MCLPAMNEFKITRQPVEDKNQWAVVQGTSARALELHPPEGEDWSLHSFEHGQDEVVAVWTRAKRPYAMSEVYAHSHEQDTAQAAVKTVADIPLPKA